MRQPQLINVQATADAMASTHEAGLGGAAFFPNGSCVWFQFRITLADAQTFWPWMESDLQKYIAMWELLAQFALTFFVSLLTCLHLILLFHFIRAVITVLQMPPLRKASP